MENAETILVVILASFLAIFLFTGILLLVKCIQVVNQIKHITEKAEELVEKAESVGEFFQQTTGRFALGRLVSHLASAVFDKEQKSRKRRD